MLAIKYVGKSKKSQQKSNFQWYWPGTSCVLTELTWQVLIEEYLTLLLFIHWLIDIWTYMIQLKSIEDDYIRILKLSVLQAMPS